MLEDRIRVAEGRPQRYGTQFDWDASGEMSPMPVEEAEHVDERRRAVGLGPLADDTRIRREYVAQTKERAPANWQQYEREKNEWFRSRGWRA
jgi:hypothetical protein